MSTLNNINTGDMVAVGNRYTDRLAMYTVTGVTENYIKIGKRLFNKRNGDERGGSGTAYPWTAEAVERMNERARIGQLQKELERLEREAKWAEREDAQREELANGIVTADTTATDSRREVRYSIAGRDIVRVSQYRKSEGGWEEAEIRTSGTEFGADWLEVFGKVMTEAVKTAKAWNAGTQKERIEREQTERAQRLARIEELKSILSTEAE